MCSYTFWLVFIFFFFLQVFIYLIVCKLGYGVWAFTYLGPPSGGSIYIYANQSSSKESSWFPRDHVDCHEWHVTLAFSLFTPSKFWHNISFPALNYPRQCLWLWDKITLYTPNLIFDDICNCNFFFLLKNSEIVISESLILHGFNIFFSITNDHMYHTYLYCVNSIIVLTQKDTFTSFLSHFGSI